MFTIPGINHHHQCNKKKQIPTIFFFCPPLSPKDSALLANDTRLDYKFNVCIYNVNSKSSVGNFPRRSLWSSDEWQTNDCTLYAVSCPLFIQAL